MNLSGKKFLARIAIAASIGIATQAGSATTQETAPTENTNSTQGNAVTVVIRDSVNNLVCFQSASGFSCATPRADNTASLPQNTSLTINGAHIAERVIDAPSGIACYTSAAGLWCGTPQADTALAIRPASNTLNDIRIDSTMMGDMGDTYRIQDPQTGLVIYANQGGIGGAARGASESGKEKDISTFSNVPVQRIRDYETGVACYFAPAARNGLACSTLKEDTTSGSDIRGIFKVNNPKLQYNIVDQGANDTMVNVSDYGVCTLFSQIANTSNKKLDYKEIQGLDGTPVTRIIDEFLGTINYSSEKGLSCSNLTVPQPAPAS